MSTASKSDFARTDLGNSSGLRAEIIDTLKGTRYFSFIPSETLEVILKDSQLVHLGADDRLISEGSEEYDTFYFLINGSVGVYVNGKYLHSINEPGDAVGEMAVITEMPRSADVIAELDTRLVEIPWQVIQTFQTSDPQRCNAFFSMMTVFLAEKLKSTTDRVHLYESFVQEVMEGQRKKDEKAAALILRYDELEKSNQILKNLATRDQMTNLYNHAELKDNLRRQITLFRRNQEPFCLVIGDLDNFKQVNDTYGHLIGDEVIRNTAGILVLSLREEIDSIYRYGGEEYAIIMRNTPEPVGAMVLDRIRIKMEVSAVQANGADICTTMSIGVGGYNPEWQMEEFIAKVDQAMYCAKRSGKNRVVSVAKAEEMEPSGKDA